MELQCVPDAHVASAKPGTSIWLRSRQERAEAQLQEQNVENAALRELVEQQKLMKERVGCRMLTTSQGC